METQEGKAEAFFRKSGKKIDSLLEEMRNSDFAKKMELENRLKELKKDGENLNKKFSDFSKDNKSTFEDIKNSIKESIEDIKNIFKKQKG
ncbi:MAG: gas vesicle protein [Marivirga sp.]|jgi:gas vesicle protein